MKNQLIFLTMVLVLLPVNGMASDVWSGDHDFKGWKGREDSNPFKNMSAASVVKNVPAVSETDFLTQGKIYLEEGKYKKAINSYERAIRANLDIAEAYKGIGLAYYKLGYNEHSSNPEVLSLAVSAFEKSLAIKQDAEAYYTLGLSYLALDNKKRAEAAHLNLKPIDSSLAATLEAKITAYGAPRNFISVRNPETERIEAEEAMQRQEARRRAAKRQATSSSTEEYVSSSDSNGKSKEQCMNEMERVITSPSGTTRMTSGQRSRAETDYEQRKIIFLQSCMGQYNAVANISQSNKQRRRGSEIEEEQHRLESENRREREESEEKQRRLDSENRRKIEDIEAEQRRVKSENYRNVFGNERSELENRRLLDQLDIERAQPRQF